ncbi:MAG: hypothetical protein K0A98_16165, partial [Trueperaceae bacterium]|nr:hypothetical protein [Trueperaceae bacterium]
MLDFSLDGKHLRGRMEIPHRPLGSGRAYQVSADTELLAFHVEAPLPHAPAGAWVYVFVFRGRARRPG